MPHTCYEVFNLCDIVSKTYLQDIVNISEVDYVIESNYEVPNTPSLEPNEKDYQIWMLIADQIPDGACM